MKKYLLLLPLTVVLAVGCYKKPVETPPPLPEPEPDPELSQFKWAELPVMNAMDDVVYVSHYVSSDGELDAQPSDKGRVRNYTVCYDETHHQPLWVAYPMHSWYDGDAGRNEKWQYDPYLPKDVQPNLSSSYNKGEYSRGHMLASSDRQRADAMNRQTFYFSNMSPQIQNEFNGGIWSKLEQKVQDWGFGCPDTLYVVTGAAFSDNPKTTSDKSGMSLPVPDYYYKVLLSSKSGQTGQSIGELPASELRCVGFWLGHFGYGTKDNLSTKEMMSVAEIEERTGFEFFPMLSAEARSVKNDVKPSDWGM
jgi:endonuclease G